MPSLGEGRVRHWTGRLPDGEEGSRDPEPSRLWPTQQAAGGGDSELGGALEPLPGLRNLVTAAGEGQLEGSGRETSAGLGH